MNNIYREKRDRIEKLKGMLNDAERDGFFSKGLEHYPEIVAFKKWRSLPEIDKNQILEAWSEYYRACNETVSAKRFRTIGEAFKRKDNATVQELAKQSRESIPELHKPTEIDPMEFEFNDIYIKYRMIESELKKSEGKIVSDAREAFL